jgi:hypothetical protein
MEETARSCLQGKAVAPISTGDTRSEDSKFMWDAKRQLIWLTTALAVSTFVVYREAHDEAGVFDPQYFALLEIIFLLVIIIMFYIYSRKK